MEDKPSAAEQYKSFGLEPDAGRSEEELAAFLAQKETEENLEKLAKRMQEEWKKGKTESYEPDLSYAAFKKKLDKS